MHRRGPRGIVFLWTTLVLYVLVPERPLIALLSLGVWVIEPVPDKDRYSGLEHRKTSYSFLSVALLGAICGDIG